MTIREDGQGKIVRLPTETPTPEPEPRPTPPGRLHGLSIAGMGASALVGITALLAFITISWPGDTGKYAIGVMLFSCLAFLVCASTAVFSAARDTYRSGSNRKEG